MKIIGIMTEDFNFFYEVVQILKRIGESFISLGFDDPIPISVGVIITSKGEKSLVNFPKVVASKDPQHSVRLALSILKGGEKFDLAIVGIDPGPRPGMAVIADDRLILKKMVHSPEKVSDEISDMISYIGFSKLMVRIGHGDPTNRNRTINAIWDMVDRIEIVDETSTTAQVGSPDVEAAMTIAQTSGHQVMECPTICPTDGEIREIQRKSRIESGGRITISSELARAVAKGVITLHEAIDSQL
jgi:hypothetical protein